nr:MAG TPA: repressor [Herelleviridae sp.]
MAKNELKNRVRFSTTLEIDINKNLKEFSQKTEIPISKIVNSAIKEYIENRSKIK